MGLSERERAILDLERDWFTLEGPKEDAIHARFGFSTTRYYQLLGKLIDRQDAFEHDPLTIKRLRRDRDHRRRIRIEGREVHPT